MTSEPERRTGSGGVQSVDRAISILQVLRRNGASSVTQIAQELELHKSTAFRLLATLEAWGLVEQSRERGKYHLGYGVVQLAAGVTQSYHQALIRQRESIELAESVGETVNIAVRDGDKIVIIDQAMGSNGVTTVNWVGQRMPMHPTAAGKVFLSEFSEAEYDEWAQEPLERFTEQTITDPSILRAQLALVDDVGYATTRGEHEVGLATIAAPIRSFDGSVTAAIVVSGPEFRLTEDEITGPVAAQLLAAAAEISKRNGYA